MAYTYSRSITIDYTKCGTADSTAFPVLVSINHTTFKDAAHSGHVTNNTTGYDIAFFSDSGLTTKIPWEVEYYNGTTGILIAWVNIATLSHTVNTVIYVGYGNAGITTAQNTSTNGPTYVWNSNFKGVWHLSNGTTLSPNDSTSNGTNGTVTGATAAAGLIDGG